MDPSLCMSEDDSTVYDSANALEDRTVFSSLDSGIAVESCTNRIVPLADDKDNIAYERDTLRERVYELENRLREQEEELEFYFSYYQKAEKRSKTAHCTSNVTQGSTTSSEGTLDVRRRSSNASLDINGAKRQSFADVDDSDLDEDDTAASGNENYTEPWSKTLGRNAALEYTRDSPMFRKRLWFFQETLGPLEAHAGKLADKIYEFCEAGETMRAKGVALAEELSSKEASRLMFGSYYPMLGDLAANMAAFSSIFKQAQELLSLLVDSIRSGLAVPLIHFKKGFRDLEGLSEELSSRGRVYEARLSKALDQRTLPSEGPIHDLAARARWDFELFRFDLVRYLNQLDAKKKLLLEAGINNAFYALLAFFQGGSEICGSEEKIMRRRQAKLADMKKRYAADDAVWSYVRGRLEAELQGSLPPPGAPPGARSPVNPRPCCPVYVANLTTEVLSADSQQASPKDMAHCRDEGVLKQGYLFRRHVWGRKERCWYRLHNSKLYTLELNRAERGDVPVAVFDLTKGATVACKPGVPGCFG